MNSSPGDSVIIDVPGNLHSGACGFSFSDGHSEIHKWQGSKLKDLPVLYQQIPLNFPAGDSWIDMHWVAENATVRTR